MPTYQQGRHEHGQNFLTDPKVIDHFVSVAAATRGPIIEIGPGSGALTRPLAVLGRDLTGVEIDPVWAARLHRQMGGRATIVAGDFLTYQLPRTPHVVVGNLPFHQTTAMLRHLLHATGWSDAILLVQWEVARRRAAVGGSTMMTSQWAPWFDFTLHGRVPARAFTPSPGVDGGLLSIHRRDQPRIPVVQQRAFQDLVHRIYTGKGRGLAQILAMNTTVGSPQRATAWLRRHGLTPDDLPRHMPTSAWIDLYRTTGISPPPRSRQPHSRRSHPTTPSRRRNP